MVEDVVDRARTDAEMIGCFAFGLDAEGDRAWFLIGRDVAQFRQLPEFFQQDGSSGVDHDVAVVAKRVLIRTF